MTNRYVVTGVVAWASPASKNDVSATAKTNAALHLAANVINEVDLGENA